MRARLHGNLEKVPSLSLDRKRGFIMRDEIDQVRKEKRNKTEQMGDEFYVVD